MLNFFYVKCFEFEFQTTLSDTEQRKTETEQDLNKKLADLKQQLESLTAEKQATETRLTGNLDDLHKKLLSNYIFVLNCIFGYRLIL